MANTNGDKAVNGILIDADQRVYIAGFGDPSLSNCFASGSGDFNPYLTVNLGLVKSIKSV